MCDFTPLAKQMWLESSVSLWPRNPLFPFGGVLSKCPCQICDTEKLKRVVKKLDSLKPVLKTEASSHPVGENLVLVRKVQFPGEGVPSGAGCGLCFKLWPSSVPLGMQHCSQCLPKSASAWSLLGRKLYLHSCTNRYPALIFY